MKSASNRRPSWSRRHAHTHPEKQRCHHSNGLSTHRKERMKWCEESDRKRERTTNENNNNIHTNNNKKESKITFAIARISWYGLTCTLNMWTPFTHAIRNFIFAHLLTEQSEKKIEKVMQWKTNEWTNEGKNKVN